MSEKVKKTLGKGVNVEYNSEELIIRIDLTKRFGESSSGKSKTVATTSGNKGIGKEDIKLGLNCYTPVKSE